MFDWFKSKAVEICDAFSAKLKSYTAARSELRAALAAGRVPSADRAEAQELLSSGDTLEKLANDANGYTVKVRAWIAGTISDEALTAGGTTSSQVDGLGFIDPFSLTIIAVIVACTAALGKWLLNYAEFRDRVQFAKDAKLTGSAAKDFVGGQGEKKDLFSAVGDLKDLALYGGMGFGAFLLFKALSRKKA